MNKSNKGASSFNFFGRKKFEALVKRWGADKGVRGFSTWELVRPAGLKLSYKARRQ